MSYWVSPRQAALRDQRLTVEAHCRQIAAVTCEAFGIAKMLGATSDKAKAYDELRREAEAHNQALPIPLCAWIAKAGPYPVDALGPLADAARAIAAKVQAPLAIAGQSVLAAASLGAQAFADVALPFGQRRPFNLCNYNRGVWGQKDDRRQ